MNINRAWICCAACLTLTGAAFGQASRQDRDNLYDKALEAIFAGAPPSQDNPLTVIVRFQPSLYPESQLELRYSDKGVEASYVRLEHMLIQSVDKFWPKMTSGDEIVGDAKRSILTRHFDAVWAERSSVEFWNALAKSPPAMKQRQVAGIMIDPTIYTISIYAPHLSIEISIADQEAVKGRPGGTVEIVRWVNAIRLEMEE